MILLSLVSLAQHVRRTGIRYSLPIGLSAFTFAAARGITGKKVEDVQARQTAQQAAPQQPQAAAQQQQPGAGECVHTLVYWIPHIHWFAFRLNGCFEFITPKNVTISPIKRIDKMFLKALR